MFLTTHNEGLSRPDDTSLSLPSKNQQSSTIELATKRRYDILPVDNESIIKFARERKNKRVARIQISLFNDGTNVLDWKIRSTTTAIRAIPSGRGQIPCHGNVKFLLIWVLPDHIETWEEMKPPKLLFSIKLLDSNVVVGSANIKFFVEVYYQNYFSGKIEMNEFCTTKNPPIHNLIFDSEMSKLSNGNSEVPLQTAMECSEMMLQIIYFSLDPSYHYIARVELSLINDSKQYLVWKLKTSSEFIKAMPSGTGLLPSYESSKCILIWDLSRHFYSCQKPPSERLILFARAYTSTGQLLGEEIAKYMIKPNSSHTKHVPVHQLVLASEKAYNEEKQFTRMSTAASTNV
ncbi:unnamed protein product [Thelazia callipaeda]|uniref:Major sperm protein n=1 Tax=Thelazia callipaeda TaxID=103827 RepID=A0A0N5CMC1_THECL|nr:unnamed protein product [Thelazia callipaeda]